MRRSKVSLIFDGVSGETFMIRLMPENTTGILLDTRIYFDCLMFPAISFTAECKGPSECISSVFFQRRFMSRSKVSLIFDGVSGETFHDSPDAGKYNWNTARHTNLFWLLFLAISFTAESVRGRGG